MNKLSKTLQKLLPRIGALALSLVICAGVVVGYFLTHKAGSDVKHTAGFADKNKNDNIKDDPDLSVTLEDNYNFLIMGHDRAASLTDVMLIVNFDVKNSAVTIMQLPRDTFVRVDDNYFYHKVNGVYNYFVMQAEEEGSKDPEYDGCLKVADFIEENLAIEIHYSAVMDLDGFASIVDAIGGVDMYVPQTMIYNDPGQNLYIQLYEGQQHLDGNTAEQFVRYRSGYYNGDIGRGDAQKLFMTAFIDSLKNNVSLSMLADIASTVLSSVKTDVPLQDIIAFGKELLDVDLEKITMFTLPGNAPPLYEGASYYVLNKEAVCEYIHKYYNIYTGLTLDKVKSYFDTDNIFTTTEYSVISEYYNADKDSAYYSLYDAQELENNGLN